MTAPDIAFTVQGVGITELRGLLERATPGPPWRTLDEYIDSADQPPPIASAFYTSATMKGGEHHEAALDNAALIVAAVNALPTLLDTIANHAIALAEAERRGAERMRERAWLKVSDWDEMAAIRAIPVEGSEGL